MATFRLFGESGLTAQAITKHLGIVPSDSFEAGTPIRRRPGKFYESSGWFLSSSISV